MPFAASGDHFGQSIAVDGEAILVGAIHDNVGNELDAGSAHVFSKDASGVWTHVDELTGTVDNDDNFGHSVAISGGRSIVGSSNDDEFGDNAGAVQVNFTYGATPDAPPVFTGVGTAGCNGPLTLDMNTPPRVGNLGFGLQAEAVEPSSAGFLGLGNVADLVGSDPFGLGAVLHVDPISSSLFFLLTMTSDADGKGFASVPIPASPGLAGLELHAQALWLTSSCGLSASSSNLVSFTILPE